VALAANNPNLQELHLQCERLASSAEPHLQHLFTSCQHLTSLDLFRSFVSPPALDAILTHGTSLTSLAVDTVKAVFDRTTVACSWQKLCVYDLHEPVLHHLANLPLHSVRELRVGDNSINTLQLPYSTMIFDSVPEVLHQAALNLAGCPAWKEANITGIRVMVEPHATSALPAGAKYSSRLSRQLIAALAPLASPRITELEIDPEVHTGEEQHKVKFKWGRRQVGCMLALCCSVRLLCSP
jgi:hypothetical protein